MTVLAVLAVLESTLRSFCLSYETQYQEAAVTVLTVLVVSAVVALLVVTATPGKLDPLFRHPDRWCSLGCCCVPKPITSFEAKKWLEVNFPSRGKVINFPSSRKNSFFSNPSFHGKTGHFKGKGKIFSREDYP